MSEECECGFDHWPLPCKEPETKGELAAPKGSDDSGIFWECEFEGSRYVVERLGDIMHEIEDADVGNAHTVRKIRMTRKEFEALPEFNGF